MIHIQTKTEIVLMMYNTNTKELVESGEPASRSHNGCESSRCNKTR